MPLIDEFAEIGFAIVPIETQVERIARDNAARDAQTSNVFGTILRNTDGSYRV